MLGVVQGEESSSQMKRLRFFLLREEGKGLSSDSEQGRKDISTQKFGST